jgi:8-oxo-dGTP pyrophosphatase MutT (NUDIX family)|tara:strand:- start:10628 stop:11335 length:708 start_codon:yes stop_codon:yes gene_type:complete
LNLESWLIENTTADKPLIPASTVIPIRDSANGLEVLMIKRNTKLSFAEGMWVFPGGKVEEGDWIGADNDEHVAKKTACRECYEESGLNIDQTDLVYYSHWLPPIEAPKRFSTWFFIVRAPETTVKIDDGEITDYAWCRADEALERSHSNLIEILPPTWITLFDLTQFSSVNEAIDSVSSRGPRAYATKMTKTSDGLAAVWQGDCDYDPDTIESSSYHRLVMTDSVWKFQLGSNVN